MSMSESSVQQRIRLFAAYHNIELWRNNRGACTDQTGRQIRYGLGNDSAALNKRIKSSDLIGLIPWMNGKFLAVECKPEGWVFPNPTNVAEYEHCMAQQAYIDIVRRAGGVAGFVTSEDDFKRLVGLS